MNLFGFPSLRVAGKPKQELVEKASLNPVASTMNLLVGFIRESFAGAWQGNITTTPTSNLSYFAVYACISLIAQDISKMRPKLMQQSGDTGIWSEITSAAFTPVLRKPNHYQTRIKFLESWVTSKLIWGNTYVLKERDSRGIVIRLYVLDPQRVTPLVSDSGDVFYNLKTDYLAGLNGMDITVPASEIIHDTAVTLSHPLVGVSPLYACGLAATNGVKIQNNSTKFFANMSRPSGMLSAPGHIGDDTAARLKDAWDTNFGGDNIGKTAVVGDGLKYEAFSVTPQDAQMIEQLKMSAEIVCSAYHVPPYKVGIGAMPPYNNVEALNLEYYSQALQAPIESIELLLDEGLGLPDLGYGVELDLDNLLRMDSATRYDTLNKAVGGGWLAPNEARRRESYKPVKGGESPYLQQQNYSLEALAKRDAQADPFKPNTPPTPAAPPQPPQNGSAQDMPKPDTPPPAKDIDPAVSAMIWEALLRKEFDVEPAATQLPHFTINMPEQAAPLVQITNEAAQPQTIVQPVHFTAGDVQVDNHMPPLQVTNEVKSPDVSVTVEGANLTVVPSEVVVREIPAAEVHITNEAAAAPDVHITNQVQTPDVQIRNVTNVPAPVVQVTNQVDVVTPPPEVVVNVPDPPPANIIVEAPVVQVTNEVKAADYETVEQEIIRDDKGRAKGMKTTKRRKK